MTHPLLNGLALTILAAICSGAMGYLLRLQRRYAWENTWALSQFVTMIFLPSAVVQFFLPNWLRAIGWVGGAVIAIIAGLGFLWGIGSVAFAIGIESAGLSLGYAVIMGVITSVGSIIPMVRKWSTIPAPAKLVTLLGITICLVGVALYGKAGLLREHGTKVVSAASPAAHPSSVKPLTSTMIYALGWCVLSGVLSAGNNIGFDVAGPIAGELQRLGTDALLASLVRWLPVFWGGYLAVLVFSGSTMVKKGTWKNFVAAGTGYEFARAVALGALSFLALVSYGMGASSLGPLGTTIGYATFLSLSIVAALVFGFMLGEWKGAPRPSLRTLFVGMSVLIAAVIVLAYGNSLVR
jgi:L-rhamnose-H+ transport protein